MIITLLVAKMDRHEIITVPDNYTDVAISAPFAETNGNEPGTVFIYHSTPNTLLSNEPQQVGDVILITWHCMRYTIVSVITILL